MRQLLAILISLFGIKALILLSCLNSIEKKNFFIFNERGALPFFYTNVEKKKVVI